MKKLLVFILAFSSLYTLTSQSYDLAAGVRLGTDIGVSLKLRLPPLDENFTLETIVQSSMERDEGMFTFLAAQHFPLITRRINLYAGGGVHLGWLNTKDKEVVVAYDAPKGVSLIAGAEINFKNINISADFKPAINIKGGEKRMYSQTAFTLRFIPFKRYDIFESPREKRKKERIRNRESRKRDRQKSGKQSWQFWKKG